MVDLLLISPTIKNGRPPLKRGGFFIPDTSSYTSDKAPSGNYPSPLLGLGYRL